MTQDLQYQSDLKRLELQKLISPELLEIMNACARIEKKVGLVPCQEREAAIQLAVTNAISSFTNIPCAIIGWGELQNSAAAKADLALTNVCAVSWAHDVFISSPNNLDAFLSFLMAKLTDRLGIEQFELVELVQNRRAARLGIQLGAEK